MKKLMHILSLFIVWFGCTGFNHVDKLKKSFLFVEATLQVKERKLDFSIELVKETDETIEDVNKALEFFKITRGSAFVSSHKTNKTIVLTANHLCVSLDSYKDLLKTDYFKTAYALLKHKLVKNKLLFDTFYEIGIKVKLKDYWGNVYIVDKIIKQSKEYDLCSLSVNKVFGQALEHADKCQDEMIYNYSASGGFYYPKGIPLRRGYLNSRLKEMSATDNDNFKDFNQYTLPVTGGASGSAVINKNGKLCGMITLAQSSIGLSYGPNIDQIKTFIKQ